MTVPSFKFIKKKDKMQRTAKLLCLILGLLLLLLAGCDDKLDMEVGISACSYPCLNPDGDLLAVLVGLKVKGQDRSAVLETRPVLLKLNEKSFLKSYRQLKGWVFRDMAWRPAHDNQLYYVTYEKVFNTNSNSFGSLYDNSTEKWFKPGAGKLLKLDVNSDGNFPTVISQKDYPAILACLKWSPDGKTLAGLALNPTGQYQSIISGEFAISSDGGKSSELIGIKKAVGNPVWLNENELYLRTDKNTIVKISRGNQGYEITETLTTDFDVILTGSFQEKPVYISYPRKDENGRSLDKSRRLFVGDKLIYETENLRFNSITFSENIVLEADKKIIILNENLSLCHERELARKTHLLNFQPK